jgi:hypothetical protein
LSRKTPVLPYPCGPDPPEIAAGQGFEEEPFLEVGPGRGAASAKESFFFLLLTFIFADLYTLEGKSEN